MKFRKKLTKIGTSYGVILPKPLLSMLQISPSCLVEIETTKDEIVIRKADRKMCTISDHTTEELIEELHRRGIK